MVLMLKQCEGQSTKFTTFAPGKSRQFVYYFTFYSSIYFIQQRRNGTTEDCMASTALAQSYHQVYHNHAPFRECERGRT